jgi:CIC family chloride channel protein
MPLRNDKQGGEGRNEVGGSLLKLGGLALLVGGFAGLVGAAFRLTLLRADEYRDRLAAWAQGASVPGLLLLVAGCAAATAVAAWLVRRFSPPASGSGIPHVEAVLREELPQAPYRLIPVKFVGGVLAIGSGLALGREGPSVQMGASLAHLLGRVFRCSSSDCLVLMAGGAGAGLATAFNAPIAGAVFVLEELVRCFDVRITIGTFGASAGAIAVSRLFLGDLPDFRLAPLPYPGFATVPLYLLLGTLAGLAGVAYNRAILGALAVTGRHSGWPVELRAAVIGASVGLVAWFAPGLVGGGDPLTQQTLAGNETVAWLALVFLIRFAMGPLCYAARTPGGLFAPMLVPGVQGGLLFGHLCSHWAPHAAPDPRALAVVGMAAFFTAVVRSPLTGMVLAVELTGCFTLLLPMLSACFAAMLLPTLLREPPIYDSLREDTVRPQKSPAPVPASGSPDEPQATTPPGARAGT